MLTLNISDADIELARYERISNPVTAIRKWMDAIHFVLMPFVGILWCFARVYQATSPGGGKLKPNKVRLKPEWGPVIFVPPAKAGGYSRALFLQNAE